MLCVRFPNRYRSATHTASSDSATVRTLRTQVHPVGGVTVESCTSLCFSNAFTLAGVEFGQECCMFGSSESFPATDDGSHYVGCDTLNPFSGVPAPMSTCAMLCAGDVLEICGGPNALNIYQFQNAAPVLAALASSSSVVSTLTTLVNSATSSNIQTVGLVNINIDPSMISHVFHGCFLANRIGDPRRSVLRQLNFLCRRLGRQCNYVLQ